MTDRAWRYIAFACIALAIVAALSSLTIITVSNDGPRGNQDPISLVNHSDPRPNAIPGQRRLAIGPPPPWVCVSADTPHIHAVFATLTVSGAGLTPEQEANAMAVANTYINDTAAPKGASMKVLCDSPGHLLVSTVPVPTNDFDTVVRTVGSTLHDSGDTRYVILVNSNSPGSYAGLGQIGTIDSGTYYAVVWGYADGSLLLHELTHALSGVQGTAHAPGAPNASGYGHTRDQYDVESYADGGPLGGLIYPVRCVIKQWDCQRDDYANPSPAPGSWLETHPQFNLLSCGEKFIQVYACGGTPPPTTSTTSTTSTSTTTTSTTTTTTTPPPGTLGPPQNVTTTKSCNYVRISWTAASGPVSQYQVDKRFNGGTWASAGRVGAATRTLPVSWTANGTYDLRIRAAGSSGAVSSYVNANGLMRSC